MYFSGRPENRSSQVNQIINNGVCVMVFQRTLFLFLFVFGYSCNATANDCLKGDVHDELLGDYLSQSQLETVIREWGPYKGYLFVTDEKTIRLSLRLDRQASETLKTRTDFALEIDIVDKDKIIDDLWSFNHNFPSGVLVKKDVGFQDDYHQISILILNPHMLQRETEYVIEIHLLNSITQVGRIKLNVDLSVNFRGTIVPFCPNPFWSDDFTSGWNYFKIETDQFAEFWYHPYSTSGICWNDHEGSGFQYCATHNAIQCVAYGTEADGGQLEIEGQQCVITGSGLSTNATDPSQPALPDFITTKVWLTTPWGKEAYTYGQPETMKMHAQFENIGDGECSGDIEVHFYLSKGYKEDAHSEWERVGTDYIHCDNLEHGETHSEEEGLELWRDISAPGIWNIVACVDHYRDDHNNGGDYPEEHESNNCSTEAVFEVTADGNVVNVLDIDFTAHSLQFLQEPYYAGDQARFRAAVVNIGSDVSTSGIRSNYSVECPGTGRVYLTDDGTDADDLTPNATNWEETKALVTMPNAVGDCVAYFCADYQGAITETDETNNCATLPFTLHQRVFRWSSAGAIAGMVCTQITEAAEPKKYTWYDNFFCAQQDYGIRWNSAGPIAGMRCTQITEAAEPKKYTWNDNYLCVPTDSPLRFYWSSAGLVSGKRCTQWSEPADPYTWNDNFLCYD